MWYQILQLIRTEKKKDQLIFLQDLFQLDISFTITYWSHEECWHNSLNCVQACTSYRAYSYTLKCIHRYLKLHSYKLACHIEHSVECIHIRPHLHLSWYIHCSGMFRHWFLTPNLNIWCIKYKDTIKKQCKDRNLTLDVSKNTTRSKMGTNNQQIMEKWSAIAANESNKWKGSCVSHTCIYTLHTKGTSPSDRA